jgi:hypothetical protein
MAGYLLAGHYHAMCIWPFLFVRMEVDIAANASTLNHERIHARQQLEMLWLLFFVWYGVEYLMRLWKYRNRHQAYHALSFEKEAYTHDENRDYLKTRRPFAWISYL